MALTLHVIQQLAPSAERVEVWSGEVPWEKTVALHGADVSDVDVGLVEQALKFQRHAGEVWRVVRS